MREPTEMEMRCARKACCGEEDDGQCKRGPEFCDAIDYLRMVRAVIREMYEPTPEMVDALESRVYEDKPLATDTSRAYTLDGIRAMIDAASPAETP